jgi:hypothetical protein
MFSKIHSQIEEFTSTIKESEGCDKMLAYIDSNIYSAIKLLIFSSKVFSILGRVLLFFIVFLTGVLVLSAIGALGFNIFLLSVLIIVLFISLLFFVVHWKKTLINSIVNKKAKMEK